MISLVPMTVKAAAAYAASVHRHHTKRVAGGLFACGIVDGGGQIRGVAIVARPARMAQDGFTAQVSRVGTDGVRNGCSMLYGACVKALRALGWRRALTYTLAEESGASLRACGWTDDGVQAGGEYSRPSRRRDGARYPTGAKRRWVINLQPGALPTPGETP